MTTDSNTDGIDNVVKYSTEQFDKNILFIASGGLGVSFAFIKDIVPNLETAVHKCNLISSWYLFAGVIFISLVNHNISMLMGAWARKNSFLKDDEFNNKITKKNWIIRILNWVTIVGILIGAILLIRFINANI
ncbi:MAG: hypothetical protein ACOCWG_05905 [bacterium]